MNDVSLALTPSSLSTASRMGWISRKHLMSSAAASAGPAGRPWCTPHSAERPFHWPPLGCLRSACHTHPVAPPCSKYDMSKYLPSFARHDGAPFCLWNMISSIISSRSNALKQFLMSMETRIASGSSSIIDTMVLIISRPPGTATPTWCGIISSLRSFLSWMVAALSVSLMRTSLIAMGLIFRGVVSSVSAASTCAW